MFRVIFLMVSIIFYSLRFSVCFAQDSPPEPGATCIEEDAVYNYTSNINKTPWKLNDLYAVPPGTIDPLDWESSPAFHAQFLAELDSGDTPQLYAQACASVWQTFFTSNAAVLVKLNRTISTTNTTLNCKSGTWVTVSTENLDTNDTSDWLVSNSNGYIVTETGSEQLLNSDLQSLLNNLNAQPGAHEI